MSINCCYCLMRIFATAAFLSSGVLLLFFLIWLLEKNILYWNKLNAEESEMKKKNFWNIEKNKMLIKEKSSNKK